MPRTAATPTLPLDAPPREEARVDAQLVQDTKQQIRGLVAEIETLARSDVPLGEFYAGYLPRVVSALAAVGGAIWTRTPDGELQLAYQVNLPQCDIGTERAARQHALLLAKIWETQAQPQLVPPHAGSQQPDEPGNPTEHLLVVAPLAVEQQTIALVEIFQRAGGGPTTQRGYLRFLMQMCATGSDYLKNRRLAQYHDAQALWDQFESFVGDLHRRLDVRYTSFTLANEGRRISGCDRVTVLLGGRRPHISSVSGLDSIDRRAAEVRLMEQLAAVVLKAGEPVYFAGDSSQLPPQIDDALHQFVDRSQARAVGVVPLVPPGEAGTNRKPIGVLVVERWQQSRWTEASQQRIGTLAAHGATALANAQEHQSIFLLPLLKAIGKVAWLAKLPKALLVVAVLCGIGAALAMVPYDFQLAARGKLQPADRREIFAATDGVVVDVPVDHGQFVAAGEVLATLRNTDLDVEIANLLGKKTTAEEQLSTAQRALLNESQLSIEEQNRIAGQIEELKQTLENITQQLDLYAFKQQQLVVRSDRAGQVVTWGVRDLLLSRPVQRGQVLMTLVEPSGDWILELALPEKRLGHALAAYDAAQRAGRPLEVTFQLSTHPGEEFRGEVIEIERRAEVRGEEGSIVLTRVAIEKARLPELHSETTVAAQVQCGPRPLGYVLFQDVIETVQKQWLLWF
jgi:multidrug resistance efflux pump